MAMRFKTKRVMGEFQDLALYMMEGGYRIAMDEKNDRALPSALFEVPITSGIYAGQKHVVRIDLVWGTNDEHIFPDCFPLCHIETPIYHPNIDKRGNICVSILTFDGWNPVFTLITIVNSIILLLNTPNPDSPQWKEPAGDYRDMSEVDFAEKAMKYYRNNLDEKIFGQFDDWTPEKFYTTMGGKKENLEKIVREREESKKQIALHSANLK